MCLAVPVDRNLVAVSSDDHSGSNQGTSEDFAVKCSIAPASALPAPVTERSNQIRQQTDLDVRVDRGGNTIQQDKGKSEGERGRELNFAHEF